MPETQDRAQAAPLYPLEQPPQYTEQGYLQARVYTARQALPISGATVTISRREPGGGQTLLFAGQTDSSGLTQVFTLPAPPRSLSQTPGAYQPFAQYVMSIAADGYSSVTLEPVYVFSGVTSVQPAELIPLRAAQDVQEVG